jgi:hypothetical protein
MHIIGQPQFKTTQKFICPTTLTNYHHSNISLVISVDLDSIVYHQIHELIEPTECANNNTVCIQLD